MQEFIDNRIIQGNTLEVLREMPAEYVDTIITSPPYWGLRDYGKETKIVWGGDENCEHKFILENQKINSMGYSDKSTLLGFSNPNTKGRRLAQEAPKVSEGFCPKCGAWYGQLGLEPTLNLYLNHLLQITMELKRVLKPTGVMFWIHGDCYNAGRTGGHPGGKSQWKDNRYPVQSGVNVVDISAKCMVMQNYRLILKMIDEQGWILRNTIVWHKPNHMPSSVKDRFASSYEPVFMLVKNRSYYFDLDAVRIPLNPDSWRESKRGKNNPKGGDRQGLDNWIQNPAGKNPGDIWTIPTQPFPEAHFATFPEKLVEPMIKAGCPENGIVLDPFAGAGTTCMVAKKLGRYYVGIELSGVYCQMAERRIDSVARQAELSLFC